MAKRKPRLEQPPFPPLQWDGSFWAGEIALPAWRRFLKRGERIGLSVATDDETPPAPEQAEACRFLLDHDKAVADVILQGIVAEQPWWNVDDYEEEIEEPAHLVGKIRLDSVLIHQVFRDGAAYLGFTFSCDWEEEHGLGVMMHRDRVVALGGADVAILAWIARDDVGKPE